MAQRSQLYRSLLRRYDIRRTAALREAEQRRQAIYHRLPRVEEIDGQLRLLGISTAKAVLQHPEAADDTVAQLKQKQQALQEERTALLLANGISPGEEKPHFQCAQCEDTGFVRGEPCSCFTQALVEEAYAQSHLQALLGGENFDRFSLAYYDDAPWPGERLTPRENMRRVLAACQTFVEQFGRREENLLLYGSPGLGKTFLCGAIARALLDQGHTVFYATAPALFVQLEKEQFHDGEEEEPEGFFEELLEVELLLIDDLGTEFFTSFTASRLFALLNTRLLAGRSTVLSTNLSLKDLAERYTDRVASRLMGNFTALKCYGEDVRLKLRFGQKD